MPLMPGKDAMRSNIREMIRSGKKPKEAIAAALAMGRKKMAAGGMVESDDEMLSKGPEDYQSTMGELMERGNYRPQDISNPAQMDEDKRIAEALRRQTQDALGMDGMAHYAMGGLVEGEEDSDLGNKPDEDMVADTDEPMSAMPMKASPMEHRVPMLTDDAMSAIEEKRKKRRYV